jgi:L-ribulose-5-phosphate 4-epimerase
MVGDAEITNLDERTVLAAAVASLFENNVMSRTGHGDVSSRVDHTNLLLSVEGRIRRMAPSGFADVTIDGENPDGRLDNLKMEIASLHASIYRAREDVNCIIHTHSPNLLAFAMANRPLPCRYEAMRFGQAETVPVVPWTARGTDAWIDGILSVLADHPQTSALLLGNHGVLVLGPDVAKAVTTVTVLEEAAEGELLAEPIGGAVDALKPSNPMAGKG